MNHHFIGTRRAVVALCLGLLVVALGALTASAANTIVTPGSPDGWGPTDVRADATVGITADNPRDGLGSLKFTTNTITPGQDKADFTKTWAVPARTLGSLSDVSFEYYRDAASTVNADLSPVFRLLWWQDNAPAGAGPEDHTGYLIWEGTYNGIPVAPTNSWEAENLFTQYFWMRVVSGPNTAGGCYKTIQNFSVTLNDWLTTNPQGVGGDCVAPDIDATTYITGVNTGVGSGWGNAFLGYVDNVVVAFGADTVSANFEPNPQCTSVCYADAVGGNDANGGTSAADAKKTIQAAIDAVSAGGQVRVLPGSYDETATNRWVLGINGPHQFGLFVEDNTKDGISILGVTAADVEITDPSMTLADITTNATNNFGYSGIFVEADNVTIAGLEIGANTPGENKTIEIIGDNFTLKNSLMTGDGIDGAFPYVNDWRYDSGTNTAVVESYTFDNNIFHTGSQIAISSGAGGSGPASGRQITDNQFTMGPGQTWPSISFNGAGGVAWFTYPVGGAVITGNTFSNTSYGAGQWIRARGDYIEAQFDWSSYWNDNTYDNATVTYPVSLADPQTYAYGAFTNVRRIGAKIQPEIDELAQSGDTVLVNEGTYVEQVVVDTSLTLKGEDGKAVTFIQAPATMPAASNPDSTIVKIFGAGVSVEMFGFTVTGPGPTGCGSILAGIFVRDGAYANIHDNTISDVRDTGLSGCQNGIGIYVGRQSLATTGTADITNNTIKTYQKAGIVVDNTGSQADITGNTILGDGPIAYIAENGIQVSRGASAEINNNTISGHSYSPFTWVSTGIYVWAAGATNTDGNTISENQVGVYIVDTDGTHKNNTINATSTGTGSPGFWGMIVDAPPPTHVPQPVDGDAAAAAPSVGPNSPAPEQTVLVTGNNFTSDNSAGGVGLETDGGYGSYDIDLTATKNIIHNWEYGVYVLECSSGCTGTDFANVAINRNSIVGNTEYGMFADTLTPVTDGTCNWWGNASGPSDAGPGTGDKVGTDIDHDPWLGSSNLDGPCPAPANVCNLPDASPLWTDIIGKGMGSPKKHKSQMKMTVPNYASVDSLYGQLVAKNNGHANYVRFILPGKNNYVQVNAITSPGVQQAGNFWYGDYIPPAKTVTGRWFLQTSGTKNHIPRAMVLYPTYESATNTYVNIWNTYDAAEGEVYWDTTLGWTPTQVITESIAPPNAPTTFNVELALVDNDKDSRPVWVTVEAGGVTQTQTPNNPNAGDQLNLMTFTLAGVPAGTDEITITVYSPSVALDGVEGDSAMLVGMAANYMCAPLFN